MNSKPERKKWIIPILIAAVLVVSAIVIAIVVGGRSDNPVVETPAESPVGVYYYDTAEGEYLLTLSNGNMFTIAGPSLNKSGKCVVTDSGIELDFVKDEDGTGAITIDGDVLNLQYNGKTMRFLKKVIYAVSFEVNGGSRVESVNVVNGKTVSKPADPKKDGSVFIGWYADESCTKLYQFGTEAITANTTVYAKWAQTVVGQNEYTVDFDLGCEAEGFAAMTTIGGKLYNVPTPEREGYTFGGWWISMTEQADKLTYQYQEDLIFQANTTLFAVWQEASTGSKLEAPMVDVFADSIEWNTVNGASTYQLTITDKDGNVVHEEKVGGTTKIFSFDDLAAGEYTVQVTALSSVSENNSDTTVRTFINKALNRVSLFTVVDGGILLWNGVEGAEKYLITVDCGNDKHKHTAFDNGSSTTYMFTNCSMQEGGIKFTVTAVGDGKASSVSETFVYERKLDAVGQILYNEENQSFYWDAVANAAKYSVTVKAGGKTFTVDNGSATTFSAKYLSGDITLEIIPMTQGYNSPEAATTTYTKTSLATPEGLMVKGTILSWNAVEGATGYMVKINNQSFQAESNSLDLTTTTLTLDSSTTYDISVMAVGTESSLYSDMITMKYLATIGSVSYQHNTVTWTPVIGVENYEVRVNGGEPTPVTGNSLEVKLTKAGVNVIEVRYTDNDGSDWIAIEVYAYEVTYESRTLEGSYTEYLAVGDIMTLPETFALEGYDFTGWYNSPVGANGNSAIVTGREFVGSGNVMLFANWTPKNFYVKFEGLGGITNIAAGDQQEVTYQEGYRLPVPVNPDADGEFVGWYTGPGASGMALTDAQGNCITDYAFAHDAIAYPFFNSGVLTYVYQNDGTYAVKAGPQIRSVTNVRIPEYYKGIAVTAILENAFAKISTIEKLEIPATIKIIGAGAIPNTATLKEIVVYKDTVQQNYEVFFESADGALLKHDMGTVYLEVFPRGKTGEYTIPDNVDVIRDLAFRYSKITKLTVGNSVSLIMRNAFYSCSALEVLEFKGEGTAALTIDPEAFYRTTGLTSIVLPARLTEMNLDVLDQFTKLTTIEVEAGGKYYSSVDNTICNGAGTAILYAPVTVGGEYEIPMGIREIGTAAFAGCTGLTKVIIPAYVSVIGESAFKNCTGIEAVIIEGARNGDLLIDQKAFGGCDNITTVTVQGNDKTTADSGITTIGTSAFEGISQLTAVTFESGANVIIGEKAFASNEKLANPVYETGAVIQSIGAQAFKGCTGLTEAVIPATTATVGDSAFSGCTGITQVTFEPNGLEVSFGSSVFASCTALTEIHLPATISYFDGTVFAGCDAITDVVVDPANPNFIVYEGALYTKDYTEILFYPKTLNGDLSVLHSNLQKIGAYVFQGNTKITKIHIRKNIISIGESAFSGCTALNEVTFEEGGIAMTIGESAFYKCSKLTAIELPAYTTKIGASAFESAGLTSFTIPANVTMLPNNVLKATKIKEIVIPANVESIGDGAFASCSSLATVTFEEGGTKPLMLGTLENSDTKSGVFYGTKIVNFAIDNRVTLIGAYAFYSQKNLKTLTMGEGSQLTEIGQRAFYCSSGSKLVTITLGPKVEKIGAYAFYGAKMTSLNIPNSVTLLDTYCFSKCSSLKEVTFEKDGTEDLTIGEYAFKSTKIVEITFPARLATIYSIYTTGSLNGQWKTFKVFDSVTALTAIHVEEGGKYFASDDGILYEIDEEGNPTILLCCPQARTGELEIPKEVRRIENGAFFSTKLSKITFEEYADDDPNYGRPLLEVGVGADNSLGSPTKAYAVFSPTSTLTIVFPSHLKKLGANVCYSLQGEGSAVTFNMDAHLETIEGNAFYRCDAITELHLPAVDALGIGAFYDNRGFATITMDPDSKLQTLPEGVFSNCGLTTFHVPDSVTVIGVTAFGWCRALSSITFGENSQLKMVNKEAFVETALTEITFPETVELIDGYVFQNCLRLKTVTLSKNLAGLGNNAFYECGALENVFVPEDATFYKSVDGVLFDRAQTIIYCFPAAKDPTGFALPDTIFTIEEGAFWNFKGTALVLPDSLETIAKYAFRNASLLDVQIPANVTTIGEYAFAREGDSLHSVTFAPNSKLTSIGQYAFQGNIFMKSINLPDNVNEIGRLAFGDCAALEEIVLPAALVKLEKETFLGCTGLKKFVMQEGLTTIGQNALSSADSAENGSLTELVIPSTVTEIGSGTFAKLTALQTLTFAQGSLLETINSDAFRYCRSLQELLLPESLRTIGNYAFEGCESLARVIFAENCPLTQLGDADGNGKNIFAGTTGLKEVILPAKLTSIGIGCFENSGVETISMPATVNVIGENAFRNCDNLKNADLPIELRHLGDNAYFDCNNLEVADLYFGLEYLGSGAFAFCGKLKNIYIPASITELLGNPFMGCSGVESLELDVDSVDFVLVDNILYDATGTTMLYYPAFLTAETFQIPETVTQIGPGAFSGANMKSMVIPSHITVIPNDAFRASALETVTFHAGMTAIGDYAFEGCTKLNNVTMLKNITNLGNYVFANCTSLSNFTWENGSDYYIVGTHFFDGCTAMTQVTLPMNIQLAEEEMDALTKKYNGLNVIPGYMFANTGIVDAVIPDYIIDMAAPGVFKNCKQLKSVTIQATQIRGSAIGAEYFYGCSSLKEIEIPQGMKNPFDLGTNVVNATFAECTSLEKVIINASQKNVKSGYSTFYNCVNLQSVELLYGGNPVAGFVNLYEDAFYNCTSLKAVPLYKDGHNFIYGNAFRGSGIEMLKFDIPDYTVSFNTDAPFAGMKNLKQIFFICDYVEKMNATTFTGMESEVSVYFWNHTLAEIIEMVGNDAWYTYADKNVTFYFKDTIPEGTVIPE